MKTTKPKMSMLDHMTQEAVDRALRLNRIAQASHIQIVKKNDPLILEGYLKMVEPKNATQAAFVREGDTIVELSQRGQEFLFKALA